MIRALLRAATLVAVLCVAVPASAAPSQLPVIPGPGGNQSATPVANIGYDSGTGLPCVVGSAPTCLLAVSATTTPSGTQDVNTKQVNGAAVNVGAGASGTGTQRVTTSTDSTIGTVTTITNPVAVTAAVLPLPSGAATAANQITTNTTLGSPFQAGGALGAGTALIGKVGIDQTTPGTTNGVQVNAALPAGTNVIGHTISDTGSTTAVTGTVTVSATNLSTNEAQINGVTPLMGNGVTGTGSQRVTIASDNTAIAVTAAQATASSLNAQVVGNVASAASDSGNPVKVAGVYNSSRPTFTTGQRGDIQMDSRGNLPFSIYSNGGTQDATVTSSVPDAVNRATQGNLNVLGANYAFNGGVGWDRQRSAVGAALVSTGIGSLSVEEGGRTFANISTATTTTVKSGAGHFHTLTINTFVASATITIYDNTAGSGTKIATITLPSTITSTAPQTLTYDLAYATGLTIVTSGATDLTLTYR